MASPISERAKQQASELELVVGALQESMQLSGHVRSPDGVGLPGIEVMGFPKIGGVGTWTTTKVDGSFVLSLGQDVPHSCVARLGGTTASRGGLALFAPGTSDIVLVLEPDVPTRFNVVDADTGEPIEEFALRVIRNNGGPGNFRTTVVSGNWIGHHRHGVLTIGARPGLDGYELSTFDYGDFSGAVVHDDDLGTQAIRISAGPSVRGRITRNGRGIMVKGLEIHLVRSFAAEPQTPGSKDPNRHVPSREHTTSGHAGFWLTHLDPDARYVLFADAGPEGVAYRRDVRAQLGGNDLGNLDYVPWARLEGRVAIPAGVDSKHVRIYSDAWRVELMSRVNPDGTFVFERIAPGAHTLRVHCTSGRAVKTGGTEIWLEASETSTLTRDLEL